MTGRKIRHNNIKSIFESSIFRETQSKLFVTIEGSYICAMKQHKILFDFVDFLTHSKYFVAST